MADKIARADALLRSCSFCEHSCRVDRTAGARGRCGCGEQPHVFLEGVLWGEEEFITPSYALFLAGCNLGCAFCYAAESNLHPESHEALDAAAVAARVRQCPARLASFSFIGGEPTVHLHAALRLAAALPTDLPLVWNSNCYLTEEVAGLLAGVVDVFIADLHFGNDDCAGEVAGVSPYLEVVQRNLRWASEAGRLVVRQLVLPGHVDCCTGPALRWLAQELPQVPVHVMTNFLPPASRQTCGLSRPLSEAEVAQARELAAALGLRSIE